MAGRPGERWAFGVPPPPVTWDHDGVKGDRVEIVLDVGDGVREFEVAATKAGRRVEISTGRTVVEVSEVTRSGQPVRSARFMTSRVVAMVEHPADEEDRQSRSGPRPSQQPTLGLVED